MKDAGINLSDFQEINFKRAERWHSDDPSQWSLLEWAGAMAGETAGEACNIAKKLRRLDFSLPNREAGLDASNELHLKTKLAHEVCDSIIYGLIILSHLNVDASTALAVVFNKKSEEYGFPERVSYEITTGKWTPRTLPR